MRQIDRNGGSGATASYSSEASEAGLAGCTCHLYRIGLEESEVPQHATRNRRGLEISMVRTVLRCLVIPQACSRESFARQKRAPKGPTSSGKSGTPGTNRTLAESRRRMGSSSKTVQKNNQSCGRQPTTCQGGALKDGKHQLSEPSCQLRTTSMELGRVFVFATMPS